MTSSSTFPLVVEVERASHSRAIILRGGSMLFFLGSGLISPLKYMCNLNHRADSFTEYNVKY